MKPMSMEYKRELKENWKAKWIWLDEEKSGKNKWLCFNKKVQISKEKYQELERIVTNMYAHKKDYHYNELNTHYLKVDIIDYRSHNYIGTLKKLSKFEDKVKIHPGHGPSSTLGIEKMSNPYM